MLHECQAKAGKLGSEKWFLHFDNIKEASFVTRARGNLLATKKRLKYKLRIIFCRNLRRSRTGCISVCTSFFDCLDKEV